MQTSTLSLATSIPATTRPFCAIIQLPSLLGTGSKPLQLFGLRKTPDLSHAPRQALMAFEHFGLRSSDGRLVRTARSHILANFADTRARISRQTIARGRSGCLGCTCQTRVRSLAIIAHGAAGAVSARPSLRPLLPKRDNEIAKPGQSAPRECGRLPGRASATDLPWPRGLDLNQADPASAAEFCAGRHGGTACEPSDSSSPARTKSSLPSGSRCWRS